MQLALYNEPEIIARPIILYDTEGIKYAGSKREIIPNILQVISQLPVSTVLDGFAGTTRVGQALSVNGYNVISNDISVWSREFGTCYLLNNKPAQYYQPYLDHLNNLPGVSGWFTEHYGGSAEQKASDAIDGKKKIWQKHNTMKLDAIRTEIDKIAQDDIEKSVLLTSLIMAMDKVDSTVGHQVSYLREWAPRAYNTMSMACPKLIQNDQQNRVIQNDIFPTLETEVADLAYFDPPYGSANEKMPPSRVRYNSYYHLWTTICLNDQPMIQGAANRRADSSDVISGSVFEEFRRNSNSGRFLALEAIEKTILKANANYVLISYSNQGRATKSELIDAITAFGHDFVIFEKKHKDNVMRTMKWTNDWITAEANAVTEYLFLIAKNEPLPKGLRQ